MRYARTTPSFAFRENSMPVFSMALHMCYGLEDWLLFASARLTCRLGPSNTHDAPMYWSHYDAATSLSLVEAAGLALVSHRWVAEGSGGHLFVLAQRHDA